jgi:Bacterial tandem repeat domain 1
MKRNGGFAHYLLKRSGGETMRRTVFVLLTLALATAAQAKNDLVFHGGPVLKSFEIVPYYFGPWKAADIDEQQKYLTGLAQYISGANAPASSQPTLAQYGTTSAGVHAPIKKLDGVVPAGKIKTDALLKIIHDAQTAGTVPQYADNRLIILFLPHGAALEVTGGCAYHGSEAVGKYYAMIPQDCSWLAVTAHEIFEAAIDPAINQSPGWDESVDGCSASFATWFGAVPGAYDNKLHKCSDTGYTPTSPASIPGSFTALWTPGTTPEIQMNGAAYTDYRARYDELWNVGWRLALLQPYVANGNVLYNAVWRPGTSSEFQVYGWTYDAYRAKYDALWNQGWRLKILQPYVINGELRYTAVWQKSTEGEFQLYGWALSDLKTKYDELKKQGWRLKLLQPFVLSGNAIRYTAVFRPSGETEQAEYGLTLAQFNDKQTALSKQGWRLKLFSAYSDSGQPRYTAVWKMAANDENVLPAMSYTDYRAKYDALLAGKLRLASLHAF